MTSLKDSEIIYGTTSRKLRSVAETSVKDLPIVSDDPRIQAEYVRMRMNGESHMIADMLAHQKAPRADDDTTFLAARRPREQFANSEHLGNFYANEAKKAGMNITGAIYENGLAQYPGDPNAWVRDRGEIRQKVEALGMGCEGAVNVKARNDLPPIADVDIADEIVVERALQKMDANPDLKMTPELYHECRDEVKPHWSKT